MPTGSTERIWRHRLLEFRRGRRSTAEMLAVLREPPVANLGWARLDLHRTLRRGVPESILAEGKTPAQLVRILRTLQRHAAPILVTRLAASVFAEIAPHCPALSYDPVAQLAFRAARPAPRPLGSAVVVTGGTSDVPVAEEATRTLEVLGSRTTRLYDAGVAGVHRLLAHGRLLQRARVIVVVAGMEGALASVTAGLVRCPVIAVPTSVGYGASYQGIAALLTMLNACAPGIGVVNIDNGFGAGYLAHVINRRGR